MANGMYAFQIKKELIKYCISLIIFYKLPSFMIIDNLIFNTAILFI